MTNPTAATVPSYTIRRAPAPPDLAAGWDDGAWADAETLTVAHFHAKGRPDHRPRTQARMLHDDDGISLRFRVEDRYVRCTRTNLNEMVCKDSCVEFFVQPRGEGGYLNFEFNCGGNVLSQFIEDATRTGPATFAKFRYVETGWLERVKVHASLPKRVDPEIAAPTTWHVAAFIPFELIDAYAGPVRSVAGQVWRGNVYKCGDETSHPHWGMWADVGEPLNFHKPSAFAPIRFG